MLRIQLQRALQFDDDNTEVAELIERFENDLRAEYAERIKTLQDELRSAQVAKEALGNLLAVIFRDGGHRQADIGDDIEAVRQAMDVIYQLREDMDEQRVRELESVIRRLQSDREHFHRLIHPDESYQTCGYSICIEQRDLANDLPAPSLSVAKCRANAYADPPTDCGWPVCGCDPDALRIIDDLEEIGYLVQPPDARA